MNLCRMELNVGDNLQRGPGFILATRQKLRGGRAQGSTLVVLEIFDCKNLSPEVKNRLAPH
jgi:hypothetical protein